ncbi:PLATZ transcription factor family protein [Actinidia rufa]|uniref:PLATZ transcription factor family protein n=1 Tax=Actinidia rufa TaxID=165716 RepID=A0A7J0GXE9_9ERIC|nr:PLATZ transcription factor family protein [Actinidia rufa]
MGPDEEDNRWPPWLKPASFARELLRSMQITRRFAQERMQYVLLGLYERCSLFSLSELPQGPPCHTGLLASDF